jgi:hypothetical protein
LRPIALARYSAASAARNTASLLSTSRRRASSAAESCSNDALTTLTLIERAGGNGVTGQHGRAGMDRLTQIVGEAVRLCRGRLRHRHDELISP